MAVRYRTLVWKREGDILSPIRAQVVDGPMIILDDITETNMTEEERVEIENIILSSNQT